MGCVYLDMGLRDISLAIEQNNNKMLTFQKKKKETHKIMVMHYRKSYAKIAEMLKVLMVLEFLFWVLLCFLLLMGLAIIVANYLLFFQNVGKSN